MLKQKHLTFKVLTSTRGVLQGHILTNLMINTLMDANADWKLEKSPILRTVKS